jgi:hypothetical protein
VEKSGEFQRNLLAEASLAQRHHHAPRCARLEGTAYHTAAQSLKATGLRGLDIRQLLTTFSESCL